MTAVTPCACLKLNSQTVRRLSDCLISCAPDSVPQREFVEINFCRIGLLITYVYCYCSISTLRGWFVLLTFFHPPPTPSSSPLTSVVLMLDNMLSGIGIGLSYLFTFKIAIRLDEHQFRKGTTKLVSTSSSFPFIVALLGSVPSRPRFIAESAFM